MGILDLFRKDRVSPKEEIAGTKVLVCAFDSRFNDLLKGDAEVYKSCYPVTTVTTFAEVDELMRAVRQGYDVVHLLCDVSSIGSIADSGITGTELIELCCASNVKLLWIASDNDPAGYIKGFKAGGKHLNLVMTIKRNGPKFPAFLGALLSELAAGEAMPVAWNKLCPQIPGAAHADAPEGIFFAGRGDVRLR